MTVDSGDKLKTLSQEVLLSLACQFDMGPIHGRPAHWSNRAYVSRYEQEDGSHLWAVTSGPGKEFAWSLKLQRFEWQPSPSNREDDFLADHRFSFDEAVRIAIGLVSGVVAESTER